MGQVSSGACEQGSRIKHSVPQTATALELTLFRAYSVCLPTATARPYPLFYRRVLPAPQEAPISPDRDQFHLALAVTDRRATP